MDIEEELESVRFLRKYGEDLGYSGKKCPKCGRVRVIKFSKEYDICEKCKWCIQENDYCTDWTE